MLRTIRERRSQRVKEKGSRLSAGPWLSLHGSSQLSIVLALLTPLSGAVALTHRILLLLLLSRLLAAALLLLLLTSALTGVLSLLARVLALLLRHWGSLPCWTSGA